MLSLVFVVLAGAALTDARGAGPPSGKSPISGLGMNVNLQQLRQGLEGLQRQRQQQQQLTPNQMAEMACGNYRDSCYTSTVLSNGNVSFTEAGKTFKLPWLKKSINGGKWIKFDKRQFQGNLPDAQQYEDLTKLLKSAANAPEIMKFTVPALLRFDPPADAKHKFEKYVEARKMRAGIMEQIGQNITKLFNTSRQMNPVLLKEFNRLKALYAIQMNETMLAYLKYAQTYNVTLYNYIHPDFQKDPRVNPNLPVMPPHKIMNAPTTTVDALFYQNVGLGYVFDSVHRLFDNLNRTMTNFYVVNYATPFNEIWICSGTDPVCV